VTRSEIKKLLSSMGYKGSVRKSSMAFGKTDTWRVRRSLDGRWMLSGQSTSHIIEWIKDGRAKEAAWRLSSNRAREIWAAGPKSQRAYDCLKPICKDIEAAAIGGALIIWAETEIGGANPCQQQGG